MQATKSEQKSLENWISCYPRLKATRAKFNGEKVTV